MKDIYLVVTPFFPTPDSFRGPFVYDQVRAIRRESDYEVVVYHPTGSRDSNTCYTYGDELVHLFKIKQTPSNLFCGIFDKHNCKSLIEALRRDGVDIDRIRYVHCHTMPFGCYGMALKKQNPDLKVIVQHHSRDPYSLLYGKLASWKFNLYYRYRHSLKIAESVDLHVCVSKIIEDNLLKFPRASVLEDYKPYLNRISPLRRVKSPLIKNSCVLYNGVDCSKFYVEHKAEILQQYDIRIGCIGNFSTLKDQISLIKAVEILKENEVFPCLTLIGSGECLEFCKQYVDLKNLHKYVTFLEEVDHSLLREYYNKLDLFVLPSVYEGFGCVFAEAYACGVPFMICEGQGATELIRDDETNLWVLKKHSPKDIAAKICQFIKLKPQQHLKSSVDINFLIRNFINNI